MVQKRTKKTSQVKGFGNTFKKIFTKSPTKKNYERKIKERKDLIPIYEKRLKAQEKRKKEFHKKAKETKKNLRELVSLRKRKDKQLKLLNQKISENYYDGKYNDLS